jgi:hypothetical protein
MADKPSEQGGEEKWSKKKLSFFEKQKNKNITIHNSRQAKTNTSSKGSTRRHAFFISGVSTIMIFR